MTRRIGNIGTLDIRTASEEAVAEISRIDNVGTILFSQKTAPLLARLNIGNIGSSAEVPEDFALVTGQLELTRDVLGGDCPAPAKGFMITGQVYVLPDVEAASLERNLKGLIVTGQVFVPRSLTAAVQSKILNLTGQVISYVDGARFVRGGLNIDNAYLESLPDGSILAVAGKLRLVGEIDDGLFRRKIARLQALGKVLLREEYAESFHRAAAEFGQAKIELIPRGFRYLEEPLTLDDSALRALGSRKIATPEIVTFLADVTPESIRDHLDSLSTKTGVICPLAIRDAIRERLVQPTVPVLTFGDKLLLVEAEETLSQAELDYLEGRLTIVVFGTLTVDADVPATLLLQKLESVDNFGTIAAASPQLGGLKNRLRTRKGALVDLTRPEDDGDEADSNIGVLKL